MQRFFRSPMLWIGYMIALFKRPWRRSLGSILLAGLLAIALGVMGATPALAGLTDDRFDGGIFPLYAGNGSLVPPRVTLEASLKGDRPTLLVLYIDDSRDCKTYASVVSQFDAFYGRATDILPISIDSLPIKDRYDPTEPGYYYHGQVPQTVAFNPAGEVVLNQAGQVPLEALDDRFREIFDLLPREESVELRRRVVNEVNTELVPSNP
jgi:hypothetical protein